jgi:hypothetical protein
VFGKLENSKPGAPDLLDEKHLPSVYNLYESMEAGIKDLELRARQFFAGEGAMPK